MARHCRRMPPTSTYRPPPLEGGAGSLERLPQEAEQLALRRRISAELYGDRTRCKLQADDPGG